MIDIRQSSLKAKMRRAGKPSRYVGAHDSGRRGLGFDGPLQKACLVVGLSMPVDKPIAKCGNCDRELGESNISRLYVK
jgi:hypothetical protein